ncbi:AraC family transcriptional regulator [Natronospirillum operosum]|uniref:AraC family transcriptional regulator n=1 Tax=Natronospirillum operosum TaxID=2759953 RepID=A0A4Z0WBZ3_9GAMM|nr:AraC family transcriptional regulator [Natronospirillum operosum]TGG93443.1 AraC family transcriptional regulator [Natronospirillum operosum]
MAYISFSTADYSERDRLDIARDTYGAVAKVDIEPREGRPVQTRGQFQVLPGVAVALIESSAIEARRNAALAADGPDDLTLLVNPSARGGWISQRSQGSDIACGLGEGCLLSAGQPGNIRFFGRSSHFLCIAYTRESLVPSLASLGRVMGQPISSGAPLRLLTDYACSLIREGEGLSPASAMEAATHLHDLAALTLGGDRDARVLARGRGLRAARLRAIKADMAAHARHGDLTVEWVAKRHGVSTSYVRALFDHAGTTFTDHLLDQRLLRAHRLLTDPDLADRSVSELAFASGFNNLSWFYRAFSRRYGQTPSALRP